MPFLKTIKRKEIVFVINESVVDDSLASKIIDELSTKKRVGLDMRHVESVNSMLLVKYLLENKIKLFNLQSEVLAYFAIIMKDGFLKSYVNYFDFADNKRELIKRHFLVA